MATQVQFRRGNTADNDGFTGANGELTIDTERNEARVHDGATAGGFPIGGTPTGTMMMWAGGADSYTTVPDQWLLCDGREVSRSTYSELDAILSAAGYPFGNGNGSSTFNLPDMRGRFPLGLNDESQPAGADSSLTDRELGDEGGDEDLQSHDHSFSTTTNTDGSHNHSISAKSNDNSGSLSVPGLGRTSGVSGIVSTNTGGSHSHSVSGTTDTEGSGSSGNMPPFVALNFIIKT